jgi:uncharacterized protein YjbJ (UPF0337 family)
MNKNQIEGSVKDVAGKVQQKVGEATGNVNQQVKGVAKQVEGGCGKRRSKLSITPPRDPATSVNRITA